MMLLKDFQLNKKDEEYILNCSSKVKPAKEKSIIKALVKKNASVEDIVKIFEQHAIGNNSEGFTSAMDKRSYIQEMFDEAVTPKSQVIRSIIDEAGYQFKRNICTDLIYMLDENELIEYDDFTMGKINLLSVDTDAGSKSDFQDVVYDMAGDNPYHPIKDYLESLEWDGQDHISKLFSYLDVNDSIVTYDDGTEQSLSLVYLRKFLIGSIAKIYKENAQNMMLVLLGNQDDGKSTFSQWLCPLPKLVKEGELDPNNADTLRILREAWIWEVGELGSTYRKHDRDALKRILTQQTVTVRNPYGRRNVSKPIVTSFVGTLNHGEEQFMNDPSGNRRFHMISLRSINWDYSVDVDINQVWAQAFALFNAGEEWRLTKEESAVRNEVNKEYEAVNPDHDILNTLCDFDIGNPDYFASKNDIHSFAKEYLGYGDKTRQLYREFDNLMYKLGATEQDKTAIDGYRGWRGVRIKEKYLNNRTSVDTANKNEVSTEFRPR